MLNFLISTITFFIFTYYINVLFEFYAIEKSKGRDFLNMAIATLLSFFISQCITILTPTTVNAPTTMNVINKPSIVDKDNSKLNEQEIKEMNEILKKIY